MSSRGGRRQPRVRPRPRPALPARGPRRRRLRPAGRQQPRRDDAAVRAAPAGCARPPAASSSSSTRGAPRPPRPPTCTCSRSPAPTSRSPTGCSSSPSTRAWSTRRTSPPAPPAWTTVRRGRRAATGPAGSSGSPASREPDLRQRRPDARRRPSARWSSPPAAPSSTPRRRHRLRLRSTSRWRSACPGRPGSGWGCLTGQGNGQGGREHGQKADQLPGYRSITDPAARAHVAGVWGVDPERSARPGAVGVRAAGRPSATGGGPRALLLLRLATRWSAPPTPAHVAQRLASPRPPGRRATSCCRETAALADVVLPIAQWAEESGTMTNLEGRVLLRRKALDAAGGRAHRPRGAAPAWPQRLGCPTGFPTEPREVFDELRPGQRRRHGRLRRHHLRAAGGGRGAALAVPVGGPPRHAAAVPRPLRHPRRPGPHSSPSSSPTRSSRSTRSTRST